MRHEWLECEECGATIGELIPCGPDDDMDIREYKNYGGLASDGNYYCIECLMEVEDES